jgi:aspartate kinase
MIVKKFGGTSVGNAKRFETIATLLPEKEPVIVVLSAVAGVTTELVNIINCIEKKQTVSLQHKLNDLKNIHIQICQELLKDEQKSNFVIQKITDTFLKVEQISANSFISIAQQKWILAQGELLSSEIFFQYLSSIRNDILLLHAPEFLKLNIQGEPDTVFLKKQLTTEIALHEANHVFIIQGFICTNSFGDIDNLGRGGSDYSASLIASAIHANELQIWSDIDGFHNNDPRYVSHTKPIRNLSFDEAAELAYFGAKILHPSTIHPCKEIGIPVKLKNTLHPSDLGTIITNSYTPSNIKAVAAKDGIIAIKIKSTRMLMAHGFLKKIFDVFDEYKTSVDMITTSEIAVSLTIDNNTYFKEITEKIAQFAIVETDENQTIICVVGDFLAENQGIASTLFQVLENIPIRMISYGGSKHNISFLVSTKHKIQALQALQNILNSQKVEEGR